MSKKINVYDITYNPYEGDYTSYGTSPGGHLFFEKTDVSQDQLPVYQYEEWSGEDLDIPQNAETKISSGSDLSDLAGLGLAGLGAYYLLSDDEKSSDIGGSISDSISGGMSGLFDPQSNVLPEYSMAAMVPGMSTPTKYIPKAVYDGGDFVSNLKSTDLSTPGLFALGGAGLGYATGGGKQAFRSGLGSGLGSLVGSAITGGSSGGSALGALAGMALAGGDDNPVEKAWDEIKSWF